MLSDSPEGHILLQLVGWALASGVLAGYVKRETREKVSRLKCSKLRTPTFYLQPSDCALTDESFFQPIPQSGLDSFRRATMTTVVLSWPPA